jgi:hypothetical protein
MNAAFSDPYVESPRDPAEAARRATRVANCGKRDGAIGDSQCPEYGRDGRTYVCDAADLWDQGRE